MLGLSFTEISGDLIYIPTHIIKQSNYLVNSWPVFLTDIFRSKCGKISLNNVKTTFALQLNMF
jgi:hypothetical protein